MDNKGQKKCWDNYARQWRQSKDWVPVENNSVAMEQKEEYLEYLGDEWGDKESIRQVLEDFLFPYINRESVVVEIGCGGGRIANETLKRCGYLHCFDVSNEMIKSAKEALKEFRNKTFYLLENNVLAPPLEHASVDFVYSFDVMVHLEIRAVYVYLEQIRKILKQGKNFFLHVATTQTKMGWQNFIKTVRKGYTHQTPGSFEYFEESQIRRFAESTGFKVVKVSEEVPGNFYYERDLLFLLESV